VVDIAQILTKDPLGEEECAAGNDETTTREILDDAQETPVRTRMYMTPHVVLVHLDDRVRQTDGRDHIPSLLTDTHEEMIKTRVLGAGLVLRSLTLIEGDANGDGRGQLRGLRVLRTMKDGSGRRNTERGVGVGKGRRRRRIRKRTKRLVCCLDLSSMAVSQDFAVEEEKWCCDCTVG
jgi:hypothetical protein